MALKSRKKLEEMFEFNFQLMKLKEKIHYFINYEAYGKKVVAYIYAEDDNHRKLIADILNDYDFNVLAKDNCGRVEVQVSFFKAYGWNH